MIWTTCKYAPVEILKGFGLETERLDPQVSSAACADACTHPDLCSYARAVIEEVHCHNIQELVLTDCCDAMRRTYDALQKEGKLRFLYLLPLPHKTGEAEVQLFASCLKEFVRTYEQYSGRTFDPKKALEAYRRQARTAVAAPCQNYIRILGAHGERTLVEEVQKEFGDLPVVNDTCTGNRYLDDEINADDDFFHWYAKALLRQENPCMRMWYNGGRNRDGRQPAGVVFHTVKFCDYYGFEYLEEKNSAVKILRVETDAAALPSGQLKTRLDAFREEIGKEPHMKIRVKENGPVYVAGLDSGSASTDAVIMDGDRQILGRAVVPTGSGAEKGADTALQAALDQAGIREKDLRALITTGYGRDHIGKGDGAVTEITCHAKGAHFLDPDARTVIDIGGQDSKVICIDEKGNVLNFVMNDKCAAGTGRFLEMQAAALNLTMPEMSERGLHWQKQVTISSMCTVFAESEVVSLVAENTALEDIIHGLNMAVAKKTSSLVKRAGGRGHCIMTGGVSRNQGVVECLKEVLKTDIAVPKDAQLAGAIGACLAALERLEKA